MHSIYTLPMRIQLLTMVGVVVCSSVAIEAAPNAQSNLQSSSLSVAAPHNPAWSPNPGGTSALGGGATNEGEVLLGALSALRPSLLYSIQYGDDLPGAGGRGIKSAVHQLSARIRMALAERLTLSYAPTFTWYTNDAYQDRMNHVFLANAAFTNGKARLNIGQSYSRIYEPLYETGDQTKQDLFATFVAFGCPIAEKFSIDTSISHDVRNAEFYNDIETWSGVFRLWHHYSDVLNFGGGVTTVYNIIEPGADLSSQQLRGSVRWSYRKKLSLEMEGGVDFSRFSGDPRGHTVNPIYGANIHYQMLDTTGISFGARRTVGTSYFADQLREQAIFNLTLSQRLLTRFVLALSGTVSMTDYINAKQVGAGRLSRSDDYSVVSARLSTKLFGSLSISPFWQKTRLESNISGYTRNGSMVGLLLNWMPDALK